MPEVPSPFDNSVAANLDTLRISGAEVVDRPNGRAIHVKDPNALTQVIGWLKFTSDSGHVVYRGQSAMYTGLSASAFRTAAGGRAERHAAVMRGYIDQLLGTECTCPGGPFSFGLGHRCVERVTRASLANGVVSGSYRAVLEPLLQHYGLSTRWLDFVDNVWIALWFACHRQVQKGRHAFHLRRSPSADPSAHAYIYVVDLGDLQPTGIPGYTLGDQMRLVDLRYGVPSLYLRPHAQHGLLAAPARLTERGGDVSSRVAAVIEINLVDALDWLGHGAMTDSFVLFPSAARDVGYRRFLDHAPPPPPSLGAYTVYGSGY